MPPVMFRLPHHLTTKTPPSFDDFFFDLDSKHVNKAYKEFTKLGTYQSTYQWNKKGNVATLTFLKKNLLSGAKVELTTEPSFDEFFFDLDLKHVNKAQKV